MSSKISSDKGHDDKLRSYLRGKVIVFYKTKEAYGALSNMASGYPLKIGGIRIPTSEALYQACRFPHLPMVQEKIIAQASPMTAKMVSKPYRSDSRPDWMRVRVKIMRWCLRVKLTQHPDDFGRLLLATGDRPIVEQSRKDAFWGAKTSPEDDDTLIGENVLGRLLMELREELKSERPDGLNKVEPPSIPDFTLLGQPIPAIEVGTQKKDDERRQLVIFR